MLVADRTLSASYGPLFEGIFATMQTTHVPAWVMRHLAAPAVAVGPDGRAATAPLGLRRLEASLLSDTSLGEGDVVVTTPEALPRLLGPWVRLVAVSSSDPLGLGMSNTTTSSFWPGELYTRVWTDRMMQAIRRARDRWGFRVLAGGGGAWQYLARPDQAERHGIDTVFDGYFEDDGPRLVADVLEGRGAPGQVRSRGAGVEGVRAIRRASGMGVVELSRGCGNGCRFCTMAGRKMAHLPIETICADVATNVAAGVTSVVSSSEDLFRYGSNGRAVDFEALRRLLQALRAIPGAGFMQIDHANVSSVMQLDEPRLREVRRLLAWSRRTDYLWMNLGAESASGRLVAANAPGKIAPFRPEDWEELVEASADRLVRCGFFPVYSLVLGLPGETPEDVARTERLVQRLKRRPAAIFPVFYEPVRPADRAAGEGFCLAKMRSDHLELYASCYEANFRWVPRLVWDNQRAAGRGWLRRALFQVLGRSEVRAWRKTFARLRKEIPRRSGRGAAKMMSRPQGAASAT